MRSADIFLVKKMELNVPLPSVTPQDGAVEIEMIALVETGSSAASAISVVTAGFDHEDILVLNQDKIESSPYFEHFDDKDSNRSVCWKLMRQLKPSGMVDC